MTADISAHQQAIDKYVDMQFDNELAYYREHNPDRLAKATPEQLADCKRLIREDAIKTVAMILDADQMMERHSKGFLDPSNKSWRYLFTAVTGVELPKTVSGTDAAFRQYIGSDRYEAFLAARRAAREAQEQARSDERAAKEKQRIDAIAAKVKQGEPISGDELVDLSRSLGIDVHPRTVGMLRTRVRSIQADQAQIVGKGLPNGVYHLYQAAQLKLAG